MVTCLNLIEDRWIPVQRRSGACGPIRPAELLDPDDPPVMLLWPRPDMNLASLAFLTGLVHASMPPIDAEAWEEIKDDPPDPDRLEVALAPLSRWFSLDGDGPRFMQDLDELDGDRSSVERLFIDSSGGKTIKDNADLTVRRDRYERLGRPAAAMALYAFQQFAPAGGRGNRTSMCGGGPMYTFVEPSESPTLWDVIWANVPYGSPLTEEEITSAFPWTRATRTSEKGETIDQPGLTDGRTHCAVWFGMPRRIRLLFADEPARCELSGTDDQRPVEGLVQRPYGNNYGLWMHPVSPYYRQKPGEPWLPVHPKPGRFGYRHYLGIALQGDDTDLRRRADAVSEFASGDRRPGRGFPRVLVGGWAMDNMKPLDFVTSRVPVPLADLDATRADAAARAVRAATLLGDELAGALKDAFGVDERATGLVSDARSGFFDDTETPFRRYLAELVGTGESTAASDWLGALRRAAQSRFDGLTEPVVVSLTPEAAGRVVKARRRLASALWGRSAKGGKIHELLRLEPPDRSSAKNRSGKDRKPLVEDEAGSLSEESA